MNLQDAIFFEGIDSKVIEELQSNCNTKKFETGDVIFEKGSPADFLYILEKGDINLILKEKDMVLCQLNQPGEVFGWSAIVEKGVFTSTSVCNDSTQVLQISKQAVDKIFAQNPSAALIFYRRLGTIFSKRISKVFE